MWQPESLTRQDRWNERYGRGETAGKPPEPLLVSATANALPGRALDLACGLGRNSLHLAQTGWQVVAVDYSSVALRHLEQQASARGLEMQIVHADLERHEFQIDLDSYGLICNCCYLQRDLFPAIKAGLRSGGLFIGVFPLFDPSTAEHQMNPEFLIRTGELLHTFSDWHVQHYSEDEPQTADGHRLRARIAARKP